MNRIQNHIELNNKRLLNLRESASYIGLGTSKARVWLESIGAKYKLGARALYDRNVIDAALDDMRPTLKKEA